MSQTWRINLADERLTVYLFEVGPMFSFYGEIYICGGIIFRFLGYYLFNSN